MKFKKIIAAVTAAAMALSLAVVAPITAKADDAVKINPSIIDKAKDHASGLHQIWIQKTNEGDPVGFVLDNPSIKASDVRGIVFTIKYGKSCGWYGGAIGVNAESAGWVEKAATSNSGGKDIEFTVNDDLTAEITYYDMASPFKDSDSYAGFWIQEYGESKGDFNVIGVKLLGKKKAVLGDTAIEDAADETPAVDTPAADETPVVDETPAADETPVASEPVYTIKKNVVYKDGKKLKGKKQVVTVDGKTYVVKKNGKIYKNKTVKIGKTTYKCDKKGVAKIVKK